MNKTLIGIIGLMVIANLCFAQAKKPTIMILPSDVWCNTNGYVMEFDNQGSVVKIPDYKRAFQEDMDLINVISKINGLMAERGFPLKNAESALKSVEAQNAENSMTTSKNGAGVTESPIDRLKAVAKADIIIQLTWKVNANGPKKSITFNMQGLDSYTDKQIATAQGTGAPSFSTELPVLLEEAVNSHIDRFNGTLQSYFEDLFENGREIRIRIKKFDSWDGDLEKEYNGEELGFIIEDWLADNTVKGRFSTTDATENMMLFEQVRIPMEKNGRAIDTRRYCRDLSKFLSAPPYNITNKLVTRGLGEAYIILGEK